jgi:hypothetical protein
MQTHKQLVFLLYGIISRCNSLNSLCKNLLFLENKLQYLGIDELPASSRLSDANINRNSNVFAEIYFLLYQPYKELLSDSYIKFFINGEVDPKKVILFDSTTISLFVDIFKGAGSNPINGKKKGGLKIQACMPLSGFVSDLIYLTAASVNDKTFLGQLSYQPGSIYVFDKGYNKYSMYEK